MVIYQSFWTLTANPHILNSNCISQLASTFNKTKEQIFFRYLTQKSIVPLTGTRSEKHMCDDLDIFNFSLSSNNMLSIDSILNSLL